ncbi:MAG: class I SAM-dependent methyltransferase [Candidatus Thorarchaeota archaeon]|nr:MAG: class I SAM-dependent methyltransferase [Candidatus Thorarchaeota archaeon]
MVSKRSVFRTPVQEIRLERIPGNDPILDIGGGCEGLVSRIEGSRVCAVDLNPNEILEAQIHAPESQWVLADGRYLCIKDASFETVTAWFMLGYVSNWEDKERLLRQAHRTMKKDGLLSIMASNITTTENRHIMETVFEFPDGEVSKTGYGVAGKQDQTLDTVSLVLSRIGFDLVRAEGNRYWFRIEAKKRPA